MKKLTATFCLTLTLLLGSVSMSWSADFQKGLTAYDRGDYATALREWKPLAEQGVPDAQYKLGQLFYDGKGVSSDRKTAAMWFLRAAKLNNVDAQYKMGTLFSLGWGVPQNAGSAATWYTRAAEQGHPRAQNQLGMMYEIGEGVIENEKTAVTW
jgi:TPR repeat protein